MPHSTRHRVFALAAVLALHVALFWFVRGSTLLHAGRDEPSSALQRVSLRLVPVPTAVARPQAAPAFTKPPEPARAAPRVQRSRRAPTTTVVPDTTLSISPPIGPAPAPTVSHAEPAASAPEVSLLDSAATRRAIRASARATSLTAEVARVGGEPQRLTAQERLGQNVKDAGRGDCAKGEYAGAGMGLLSLPFLVAAAARGECAQ
jgi:hypothetical protein